MNKTMINFNDTKKVGTLLIEDEEEKKEGTIAKPELSPTSVKVPLNPAFRHTEYAKGFYKVQDQKAATAALASQVTDSDGNTTADAQRRSKLLQNEQRSKNSRSFLINPNADLPVSQFNSTSDTFFKPRTFGKKNYINQAKAAARNSRMDETIYADKNSDPSQLKAFGQHFSGTKDSVHHNADRDQQFIMPTPTPIISSRETTQRSRLLSVG